tara:strand:- start:215 stop:421 length:207 start_codon:yes stop_codon:yes gene_type:complete
MGTPGEKRIFWIDNFQGRPEGAYPFRNSLVESIEKVELSTDEKVVGIVYDGTFTIELLTTKKDKDERE